jgi:L-aspartate oxidase
LQADFLIVGSGIAALRAAIAIGESADILILTKAGPRAGNTGHAQGGIAAAIGRDDSPELHREDTLAAGDGLCDPRAVDILVGEGPAYVRELIDWGAAFDREPDGAPELAMEAAHSVRRVLHARDATGPEIGGTLWKKVSRMPNVRVHAHARAESLTIEGGCCVGVRSVDSAGAPLDSRAAATLLATGGAGQVYRETTNPPVATGDGVAMAWRAGAGVADLEFVQFHPTALNVAGHPRFLLSEALRGEGAHLINAAGERFMLGYDAMGDLAPRDRVARAIVREMARTGAPVYLSLADLDPGFVHLRFPMISEACRRAGLDLAVDPIPVGPAAHYVMGGVVTDTEGRTTIPGLFAAGEVACTGVHGANRLASNSLLEGLVFGARAGAAMSRGVAQAIDPATTATLGAGTFGTGFAATRRPTVPATKDVMWQDVGLFRDATRLRAALDAFGAPPDRDEDEESITTVARLITRAALRREESRGGHFRLDFPSRDDDAWRRRFIDFNQDGSQ